MTRKIVEEKWGIVDDEMLNVLRKYSTTNPKNWEGKILDMINKVMCENALA